MKTHLFGRDFIAEQEWSREELETALEVAVDLKRKFALKEPTPYLLHQTLLTSPTDSSSKNVPF